MTTTVTVNRTLDQQRAEHALKNIKKLQDSQYGHYVSYVSALPATIVMNGLGQALVTLLAKAKGNKDDAHHLLHDHVASWLSQHVQELNGENGQVIDKLMQHDQSVYLRAQAEAMAYLNWLKQFARAYLSDKEGQGD